MFDTNKYIIDSIEMFINKKLERVINNDRMAVVLGTKAYGRKVKYRVQMDGGEYLVNDGIGLKPESNTRVWVHIPNGNLENAYIAARME
jgi:hypothetical protein